MIVYEPKMSFDDYLQKTRVRQTREEALSKQAIDVAVKTDKVLANVALTHLKLTEPHRSADLTESWLTQVLGAKVPGALLEDAGIGDEHSGMTDRTLLKLKWNEAGVKANLPGTVFVKATPVFDEHREHIAITHMGDIEVNFYTYIQPELPHIAPAAYYARSYPGGRYILLLQDLHDLGCQPYWMGYDCSIEHARAVVTMLAQLHATFWESERFSSDLAWLRPQTHQYGWPMRHYNFLKSRYDFLQSEMGQSMPSEFRTLLQKYNEHDDAVYRFQEEQPCTALHGDTHLGNTFSYPDGSAGYFDWQCMLRGFGLKDITNFILSSLTNEQRRQHEVELIDLYIGQLEEGGIRLEKQLAWQSYCLLALESLDRNLMTINRGTYNHAEKGVLRRLECQVGSLLDHDVSGLLDCLVRKGSL
jgi:hypothetical protein